MPDIPVPGAKLVSVPLDAVDRNPFRRIGDYPYVERKIDVLLRSYADIGMWPGGVIVRKVGNRYQTAFAHHRVEAARRADFTHVDVVVMDLTDEQMISYMGRENLEDYNAEFSIMLETWEAAVNFFQVPGKKLKAVDIARRLGWTRRNPKADKVYEITTTTADACSNAASMIADGHISRDDLRGLTVDNALQICAEARKNIQALADLGKIVKRPAAEIAEAQKHVGRAAAQTAQESRDGEVAKKDLRGKVNIYTYRFAQEAKKEGRTPLFAAFAFTLATQIARWNNLDVVNEKIDVMVKELPNLVEVEDIQAVDRVVLALEQAIKRHQESIGKLTVNTANVVKLRRAAVGVEAAE